MVPIAQRYRHRSAIALLVPIVIALTALQGCAQHATTTPTTASQKVSQVLTDVAKGLQTVQTGIINANVAGLIDAATTQKILQVCQTVNQLGLQASALVRQQATATVPTGVLPLLQQMAADVNADLQQGVLSIKDQKTLTTTEAVVATIQTGLAAAVVAIGGN